MAPLGFRREASAQCLKGREGPSRVRLKDNGVYIVMGRRKGAENNWAEFLRMGQLWSTWEGAGFELREMLPPHKRRHLRNEKGSKHIPISCTIESESPIMPNRMQLEISAVPIWLLKA